MISILMALAAAAQAAPQATPQVDEAMYRNCTSLVRSKPAEAISFANNWRIKGGSIPARQCLGLAYAALERWAPAAEVFQQAAEEAEIRKDARRADLWVQAGNSWLAANDGAKARKAFDSAIATSELTQELRGEVYLDRGRAGVALDDLKGARSDIDKGLELVPADPFAWYLSAALALREGEIAKANTQILKAVELAPDDAFVLLQAGTIVGTSGDLEAAREYYARAAKAAPDSEAGKFAQGALLGLGPNTTAPAAPATGR